MRARRPWTLLMLLTVALTSAGCEALGLSDAAEEAQTEAADKAGRSWIVVSEGDRAASPSPSRYASPSPSATQRLLPPAAAPTPAATAPQCTGVLRFGAINGLTVQPGAGRATVRWYHAGGPGIVSYRLAALAQQLVSGRQPPPQWQTIDAPAGCRTLTATVTGLDSDATYIFSLDVVVTNYNGAGTRSSTLARSGVVRIG